MLPDTQHRGTSADHLLAGTLLTQGQRTMPGGNQLPYGLPNMLAEAAAANQQLGKPVEHRIVDRALNLFTSLYFAVSCHSATLKLLQWQSIAARKFLP
jgi:hypothetical protein